MGRTRRSGSQNRYVISCRTRCVTMVTWPISTRSARGRRKTTPLGHIYYFTHPKMFPALGIKRNEYFSSHNATPHASANRQLYVRNAFLQRNLVDPLLQCALVEECISPSGARLGKHRFDASALSLLLYKNMRFEWTPANNDNKVFDDVIDYSSNRDWLAFSKEMFIMCRSLFFNNCVSVERQKGVITIHSKDVLLRMRNKTVLSLYKVSVAIAPFCFSKE